MQFPESERAHSAQRRSPGRARFFLLQPPFYVTLYISPEARDVLAKRGLAGDSGEGNFGSGHIHMQAVLVMFRSDGERRSFSITRDMTVIGRREDCDLRIPLGDVSRKHCRLVRDGDMLRLEDLGSSNGTYLNGQRVQESLLAPGDSVQVGPVVFVLQIDGVPADEDLHPVTTEMVEAPAPAPAANDLGPLSPTTQSEVGDLPDLDHLAPIPADPEEDSLHMLEEAAEHPAGEPLDLDFENDPHESHPHA